MAGILCVVSLLAQAAGLDCGRALAQQAAALPSADAKTVAVELRSPAQMDDEERALIQAKKQEIRQEADFFGYDLNSGQWEYDQIVCPEMPDDVILHYRSRSRNGAESLFTAVVPRGSGRVYVVPVLFRNAVPFHAAAGSERSLSVFNHVVPQQVAEAAVQPGGKWLQLAMCYAAVAGAEPQVPQQTDADTALVQAPVPTLRMNENHSREVIFSDRNHARQYMVWIIDFSAKGQVTAASARTVADYKAREAAGQMPPEKVIPPGQEPQGKVIPAGKQPQAKTVPQ